MDEGQSFLPHSVNGGWRVIASSCRPPLVVEIDYLNLNCPTPPLGRCRAYREGGFFFSALAAAALRFFIASAVIILLKLLFCVTRRCSSSVESPIDAA